MSHKMHPGDVNAGLWHAARRNGTTDGAVGRSLHAALIRGLLDQRADVDFRPFPGSRSVRDEIRINQSHAEIIGAFEGRCTEKGGPPPPQRATGRCSCTPPPPAVDAQCSDGGVNLVYAWFGPSNIPDAEIAEESTDVAQINSDDIDAALLHDIRKRYGSA